MIWLIIAILPFVLYWPVRDGEYIFDDWYLLYEPTLGFVRRGSVREWLRIQVWPQLSGFRQLTWLSYLFNRWLAPGEWDDVKNGKFRRVAHLTNIGLHSVNALLVGSIGGWLPALIFAVHPLAIGSVAYLAARPSVLSSTFALAAVAFSLHGFPLAAAIFLPLAVLAKEDMAILVVLLSVLAPHYAWIYILPAVVFGVMRRKQLRDLLTPAEIGSGDWEDNGVPCRKGLDFHLSAISEHILRVPAWMFGFWLNPDPDCNEETPMAAFAWAGFMWATIALRGMHLGIEMMLLSPVVLYLVIQTPDIVFDYRAYFTLAGMSLILGKWAAFLPSWVLWGGLLAMSIYTCLRAWSYSSRIGYWAWVTLLSPTKARGWIQLGQAYRENDPPSFFHAEQAYLEGIKAAPDCAILYQHMAWLREHEDKFEEARKYLTEGVTRCPRSVQCWYGLGVIEEKLEHPEAAMKAFRRALELKPNHELSHFHIGRLLMDKPEGLPYLREAARLRPDIDEFQQFLAIACHNLGEDPGPDCPFRVQYIPVNA